MIIFVGGLIGAGKSSVARGLAQHLGYFYFDVDEIKREVFERDPSMEEKILKGIPVDRATREEICRIAVQRVTVLLDTNPNLVFDDTLHFRYFRNWLYDAFTELGQETLMVWVRSSEETTMARLTQARINHILKDPIPLRRRMVQDFEDFNHSLVMCPNEGSLEHTLADLCSLLKRISSIDLPASTSVEGASST